MKHIQPILKVLVALGLTGLAVFALAQNTIGGTIISNTATATFTDSGGVSRNTTSNTVTTTVQTVYSFNIEPDDGRNPAVTPTFTYTESDNFNNKSADAGATATFSYTITNNTNNDNTTADGDPVDDLPVTLTAVQDAGDDFDLSNVVITVYNFTDTNNDGFYQETETLGSAVATGTANSPLTFNFTSQSQKYAVVVTGQVPASATGNQVGRLDLRATNNDATLDNTITGANVYYENQNVARVEVNEYPHIALAKNLDSVTNNGDGTYSVQYTFNVANLGNVALSSVQITDTLPFTPASTIVSTTLSNATGGLSANASYNGTTTTTVLSGANTLAINGTGSIRLVVVVRPGSNLGPYNNTATATAESPDNPVAAGADTSDVSDSGTDPRGTGGDNDTNPGEANENDATPVTFTEDRGLGLAKSASTPTPVSGQPGIFETTLTFTVRNLSDATSGIELRNLQITDNLNLTFPSPATYTIQSRSATGLTVNSSFNGNTDQNLLAASQTLARNTTATVDVVVRFNPNGLAGPFNNSASVAATSPGSATAGNATDVSDNGSDPRGTGGDNDNNAGEANENDPTPISFTERPSVGIAKSATLLNADVDSNPTTAGPYSVRFEFTLVNLGNVALTNLAITENLVSQLGGAANYSITSAPSVFTAPTNGASEITLNTSFNGNAVTNVLLSTSTLAVGDSAVIRMTVQVTNPGAYTNQVTATGNGPAGRGSTTDTSDSGNDPDSNDDGDGTDGNENDPTTINLDAVRLLKSARVCTTADCTTVVDVTGASVRPGQYIEYTIVASNLGGQNVTGVVVTDPIPVPSQYVASTNATSGITCSTNGAAGPYAACPAGPSSTVTHVRFASVNLTANDNLAGGTDETTVKFVVYVP